jgi:hypothetical protein
MNLMAYVITLVDVRFFFKSIWVNCIFGGVKLNVWNTILNLIYCIKEYYAYLYKVIPNHALNPDRPETTMKETRENYERTTIFRSRVKRQV